MAPTILAVSWLLALLSDTAAAESVSPVERAFEDFQEKFHRHYSAEERKRRFDIFSKNYDLVMRQSKSLPYTLTITEFADLSAEEFARKYGGLAPRSANASANGAYLGPHVRNGGFLAESWDWTQKGAVNPVKNQKQCGSCWAFSTTGALEGAWAVAGHGLVSLSEQQLVDCSKDNSGCGGGSMDSAFQFLQGTAACTEASYPYQAKDGKCQTPCKEVGVPKGSVLGFRDVKKDDEAALLSAVMQQPVSVAIEADQTSFQLYHSGVLTKECGAALDHGVLLVGYGLDAASALKYWKVKNSWGPAWGEGGYVRLERKPALQAGECGIKSDPSYPVVVKARSPVELAFKAFQKTFGRYYATAEEESHRFGIFKVNYELVMQQNKSLPYKLNITQFADLSTDEFKKAFGGLAPFSLDAKANGAYLGRHNYSGTQLAGDWDWTAKGAVTPVKNQKQCGSCWAFSTTGALEGAWAVAGHKLVALSEQQLVDCAVKGNAGCGGGSMDAAFQYLQGADSCTEASYPYLAKDGKCQMPCKEVGVPKGSVLGFRDVKVDDEASLLSAVMQQPVSVAIEADQTVFQLYQKGVLTKDCGASLDHGVLLVGYGSDAESNLKYWKVKNSWGPAWGEEGYVRLERKPKIQAGECGIKSEPSYPVLAKAGALLEVALIV